MLREARVLTCECEKRHPAVVQHRHSPTHYMPRLPRPRQPAIRAVADDQRGPPGPVQHAAALERGGHVRNAQESTMRVVPAEEFFQLNQQLRVAEERAVGDVLRKQVRNLWKIVIRLLPV